MAKYGVRIKIDVKKIMKAWLFSGSKGTYLDATVFLTPDEEGQYGDHGMITQDVPKNVSEVNPQTKGPILGNCKVFWSESEQQAPQQAPSYGSQQAPPQHYQQQAAPQQAPQQSAEAFDDDLPFANPYKSIELFV